MRFAIPMNDSRLRMFLLGLLVVFVPALAFGGYRMFSPNKAAAPVPQETPANQPVGSFGSMDSPDKVKTADQFNVLLLGYGGAGHEGGFLTDANILLHFDIKNKKLAFISIPRDLWVKLPDGRQSKINAAFVANNVPAYPKEDVTLADALAGAVKTKSVIKDVTGLEPHFYIGIDFYRFQQAVDKLGGINVNVPEVVDDPWYPVTGREVELCGHTPEEVTKLSNTLSGFELEKQFPCRYEHLHYDKKMTHMDGGMALKFVRSRHGSSDFSRSLRQQAVLLGVRDALLSKKALEDPVGVFKLFASMVRTNLNENLVKNIAAILTDIGSYKVLQISLTPENVLTNSTSSAGAFILLSKTNSWDSVQAYIKTQLAQ